MISTVNVDKFYNTQRSLVQSHIQSIVNWRTNFFLFIYHFVTKNESLSFFKDEV